MEKIGARLLAKLKDSPYKFQFYVKKDSTVNACAYPGGYLVVNTALIKEAKSDDEIAGIVGHEIGHVLHRDTLRAMVRSAGLWAGLGMVTGIGGSKTTSTAGALNALRVLEGQRFSRVQETDADLTGVDLSYEAGYDPEKLIAFFTRLSKENGHSDNKLLAMLSDHPMESERIEAIRAELERLKQDKATE